MQRKQAGVNMGRVCIRNGRAAETACHRVTLPCAPKMSTPSRE